MFKKIFYAIIIINILRFMFVNGVDPAIILTCVGFAILYFLGRSSEKKKSGEDEFDRMEREYQRQKNRSGGYRGEGSDSGFFDRENRESYTKSTHYGYVDINLLPNLEAKYKESILYLLSKVMNADEHNRVCELDSVKATIRRYYKSEESQKQALSRFKEYLNYKSTANLDKFCANVVKTFNKAACESILMELFAVAYADDVYVQAEELLMRRIATNFGFNKYKYEQIHTMFLMLKKNGYYGSTGKTYSDYSSSDSGYSGNSYSGYNRGSNSGYGGGYNRGSNSSYGGGYNRGSNSGYSGGYGGGGSYSNTSQDELTKAYKTLGLDSSATNDEVKAKWKKLIIKWHPDRFASQGEEAQRNATENSKIINQAYDVICKSRGMN